MTNLELRRVIAGKEYNFLRKDEHLQGKMMFLTVGGSHAYGTDTPTSDVDVRGCARNSRSDILGLTNFEQRENHQTDTVIYGFNKLIPLLANCNPNTIELLGNAPDLYVETDEFGRQLIQNRKMFLSRRAIKSFGGYARQQLNRLNNALNRGEVSQGRQEEQAVVSCQRAMETFCDRYQAISEDELRLFVDKAVRNGFDSEIFVDMTLRHYPLRDCFGMLREMDEIVKRAASLNNRNKKDETHLGKHMMHLVRLYYTCFDILELEDIITRREREHDLLMDIRAGKYLVDGNRRVAPEFTELLERLEARLKYDAVNTSLPEHPNMDAINEFVVSVNEASCKAA